MAVSARERWIGFMALGALALLACDRLALQPFLDWRSELLARRQANAAAVTEGRAILQQEAQLKPLEHAMAAALATPAPAAEKDVLHHLRDWQGTAGVSAVSFQQIAAANEQGFGRLTFHISASGGIKAIAALLYAVESSTMPLRIDKVSLASSGTGDEIALRLTLSTICQKSTPKQVGTDRMANARGAEGLE